MQSFNTVKSLSEHTSVPSACVTRHLHSPRRVAEKFHSLRLFFLNMTLRERIVMGQMPVHESNSTAVDQAYAEECLDSDFDPVEHDAGLREVRAATLIGVAKSACDVSRSSLPSERVHCGRKNGASARRRAKQTNSTVVFWMRCSYFDGTIGTRRYEAVSPPT